MGKRMDFNAYGKLNVILWEEFSYGKINVILWEKKCPRLLLLYLGFSVQRGSRRRKTREWLQCRRHRKTPAVFRASEVVTIKAAPQEMRPHDDHMTFF